MKKTKIICTMGPNTNNRETLKQMALAGMDIARFNFSHGSHEEHLGRMELVKSVREEIGLPIAILLDTKGPEIRTGEMADDKKVRLEEGDTLILTSEDCPGTKDKISITYKTLAEEITIGQEILIDDGLIKIIVRQIKGSDVITEVLNGGELGSKRGVNIPNFSLNLPAITEKDIEDILFGIEQDVDFIAASFVRDASAVHAIRDILKKHNADIKIISKIENSEGVNHIDEIIEASDGIMVARGDLGVEIPEEKVPFIQKRLIKKCNDAYKPVITATQMLDSMMRNPRPTRAEVTDVANAIYDGTDAIMLSGETSVGKYPVEAVKTMVDIALETESHLDYEAIIQNKKLLRSKNISSAIAYSSVTTAHHLNARLVLAPTMSGFTASIVSSFKPKACVIGLSPVDKTLRAMQIYWGVRPIKTKQVNSTDVLIYAAIEAAKDAGIARIGDVAVLTAGTFSQQSRVTNMMKVVTIE
ncbi:MAG: pyruvate kinase [Lachnospiraceae bacterium]